jgi:hypothetical protein
LPDFSGFCRTNTLMCLRCLVFRRTLDLHLHVRITGANSGKHHEECVD